MKVNEFLDYMKEDYSPERIENNENNFIEYFFYYKRNIRDFLQVFKSYNQEDKTRIITFLLQMYPLSDNYLKEIILDMKVKLHDEITLDTINYICNAFIEEFGSLNIDFDNELRDLFKNLLSIRDIIDLNEAKLEKLMTSRIEYANLREKDQRLSKEIKDLESGNINDLKEKVFQKQKQYDELKTEKAELNLQLNKINRDLAELNRFSELREKVNQCRLILQEIALPKDYTDKVKLNSDV